jgi:iron complex outermembrane recepter protein
VQLLYKVRDFSALLNVHHRNMMGNSTLFRANIIKKGTNDLVDGFDFNSYPIDGDNKQSLSTTGGSLHLKWNVDGMTVHSITGREAAGYYSLGDIDGGYGTASSPPSGPGYIPFASMTAGALPMHRQLTEEVRAESNNKGPFNWIGGAYYFDEKIEINNFVYNTFAPGQPVTAEGIQHQTSQAAALFGTVNYTVSDALKLRGGLRYTDDKRDFDAHRDVFTPAGHPIGPFEAHPHTTNLSWDGSGTYELDKDTNLYARIGTAYRAPSIQGRVSSGDTISMADAERVLSYEGGLKEDFFHRRARLSLSVFHYRIKNVQLTAGSGTTNLNKLINADQAIGQGAEFDMMANLNDSWKMSLGGSFNDTEIKDPNLTVKYCGNVLNHPASGCTPTNTKVPGVNGVVYIDGNPLPRAPRWTANWTLRYERDIGDGAFFAYTDWSYRGSYNFFLYEATEYVAKPMLEGGLRLGYIWGDGKYEAAAFARNITNKVQLTAAVDFDNLTGMVNEPRTLGVQFKMNF